MADLTVPELFDNPDYFRLYQLMLATLQERERHAEIVIACDRVDALWAAKTTDPCTLSFRINALVALGRYEEAIESIVSREWKRHGIRRDCRNDSVTLQNYQLFEAYYGPLLYFNEEDMPARRVFEECGRIQLNASSDSTFMLYWVYRGGETPKCLPEVGLESVYSRLNLTLFDWPQWPDFVAGISESLLADADVSREDLLRDPEFLSKVRETLRKSEEPGPEELEIRSQYYEQRKPEIDRKLSEHFPFLND